MSAIKKWLFSILKYTIYISVAYFIYDKLNGNLSKITSFELIDMSWLLVAGFLFALHTFWNGLNWHFMIKSSGEEVTVMSQMEVYLKSFILRYVPGNIVGIMSRGTYNRPYGVPMLKSLWGWFFENVVYLMLGVLIGMNSAILLGLRPWQSSSIFIISIGAGAFVVLQNDLLKSIFEKTLLSKLPEKSRANFRVLSISLKNRLLLTLRYLVSWGIYSLSFIAIMRAVGVDESNYIVGISVNAMAWAVGYLSIITPGGAGVRESVMIVLFTNGVGLSNETSVIIALISRVVFILGELVAFLAFYIYSYSLKLFAKYSE